MRTIRRISLALLAVLAIATPALAQADRFSFNAAVGPSFGNVGTTFSSMAGLDFRVNDRTAIVGELGVLPHAPFRDAAIVAPAAESALRVNAYHWNGNVRVRPFETARLEPYVTAGLGSFRAETVVGERLGSATRIEERRTMTDLATNVGAGVVYRLKDWVGIGADYRIFFVHRDGATPKVNRFTAGLRLSLK
ncbi:MAG TPA: outer membrane beta-barrel protein [Vicinamibacterales bacterium]|nr:outer membrane beta-barrel protein [Vicinamibacterales bacterium]